MPVNLRIALFIVALVIAFTIIKILRKSMIPVKYSLLWWLADIILFLLAIWPHFFILFMDILGFATISNMIVGVFIVILIFITMSLTVIVSAQKRKITVLVQEVSLLKNKVDSM